MVLAARVADHGPVRDARYGDLFAASLPTVLAPIADASGR